MGGWVIVIDIPQTSPRQVIQGADPLSSDHFLISGEKKHVEGLEKTVPLGSAQWRTFESFFPSDVKKLQIFIERGGKT